MKKHKTTKAELKLFRDEFRRWQTALGLTDWRVVFELRDLRNSYAEIDGDVPNRVATARLAKSIEPYARVDFDPADHARHEAIHLATFRLYWLGGCRHCQAADLEEEWESLVRRLESVFDQVQENK